MPEANDNLEHENDTSLASVYFDLIKKANVENKAWTEDLALQERQNKVLEKLVEKYPTREALIDHLAQVCLDSQKSETEFAKKRNRAVKEFVADKKIWGELFENLVSAENEAFDIYAEVNKSVPQEKTKEQKERENIFIDVYTNPEKYGFPYMEYFNIPDIPFIVTREGEHLVLKAVAEVKSTKQLNSHAYQQLLPSGTRKSLEFTLSRLNQLTPQEAEKRGLNGFGRGKEMYMIKNFEQIVIMCRGIDTSNFDSLITDEDFSNEEYSEFKRILSGKHVASKVILVNAAFSRSELHHLFRALLPEVTVKIKNQTTKTQDKSRIS